MDSSLPSLQGQRGRVMDSAIPRLQEILPLTSHLSDLSSHRERGQGGLLAIYYLPLLEKEDSYAQERQEVGWGWEEGALTQ